MSDLVTILVILSFAITVQSKSDYPFVFKLLRFLSHHCSFLNNNNIKNLSSDQLPHKYWEGEYRFKNL